MEAWAGWMGEPGLGDDWLKVTGLHVNIGRSSAEDVRATASPYTGYPDWARQVFEQSVNN